MIREVKLTVEKLEAILEMGVHLGREFIIGFGDGNQVITHKETSNGTHLVEYTYKKEGLCPYESSKVEDILELLQERIEAGVASLGHAPEITLWKDDESTITHIRIN